MEPFVGAGENLPLSFIKKWRENHEVFSFVDESPNLHWMVVLNHPVQIH
jgi:hypothetical protein